MTLSRDRLFTVGSLSYTRMGLVSLFGWLIWGDFIITMMEYVVPSLAPLLLKTNGATNGEIVVIVSTLAMVMNAILNPIVSYSSDRFRSRWGRRRPFILFATPFVVFFLGAIPFVPDLLHALNPQGPLMKLLSLGPVPPLMLVFAIMVIGYQTGHMLLGTTYYYLVPDVVPAPLLGRFYALFRLVIALASIVFNYFIFGLAQNHMKAIFVTVAVAYGFFILLMCWQVKEGEYPPPLREDHAHWWSGIRNYFRECFGHSYYWWIFLTYSAWSWTSISNVFSVFFLRDEMGFSLDLVGKVAAWSSLLFVLLAYPFGILIDRWGCHKTFLLGALLTTLTSILMFFLAFNQTETICWAILRSAPFALASLAIIKWTVEVYPRDRYGQFGSAGALISSIGGAALGPLCAWWIDLVKHYRFFLLWNALFPFISVLAGLVVYRQWKALGGTAHYRAP